MSEQQVLHEPVPEKVVRYDWDDKGIYSKDAPWDILSDQRPSIIQLVDASHYDKLLASLAQSEAERERLQHTNDTLTGVIAIQVEKIAKLQLEDKSKPVVTNSAVHHRPEELETKGIGEDVAILPTAPNPHP